MRHYKKEITEEVDIMELTEDEYNQVNSLYRDIVAEKHPALAQTNQIPDVRECILTDGHIRVDLILTKQKQQPQQQ